MEQFMSVQIGNMRVDMEESQGIAYFTFIVRATPEHTAGNLHQQQSINTNIRGQMIDEGLVFTASERGLDQTAIAKLERVDSAGVLNHADRCSICLEEFKEIMDDLASGLARTPTSFIMAALLSGWKGVRRAQCVDVRYVDID